MPSFNQQAKTVIFKRERDRQTDQQRQRETDRQTDKQRQRERER